MHATESLGGHSVADEVNVVVDEFLGRLQRGERPRMAEYLDRYPQLAGMLKTILPALDVMHTGGGSEANAGTGVGGESHASGVLGDFRIIREIGRGGMGVVYEAEQISLGRAVALKVLPFAGVLDPRQLQRFRHEAQAAAQLHHPHIVPVYFVGCERGVHFYAMQYIDGRSLGELVAALRHKSGTAPTTPSRPDDEMPPPPTPSESDNTPHDAFSTLSSQHSRATPEFFQRVAQLGVQAARALAHAHGFGIVHRDVKPSNMLLDRQGNLWISDFGVAKFNSGPSMTVTGDLVGTLLYMSPEQAEGKNVITDHRADIYGLGASLYELATLQPLFTDKDRSSLLRQILDSEPKPPRQINAAIPRDLETIILKAISKETDARYASADDMADDLERFIALCPIQAKPPTLLERFSKWARRHRQAVTATFVLLVFLSLISTGAALWLYRQQTITRQALASEQQAVAAAKESAAQAMQAAEREAAMAETARQAIDEMYVQVAREWLSDEPAGTELEAKLLERALTYYERLAAEQPNNAAMHTVTITALRHVGEVRTALGRFDSAEEALQRALQAASQHLAESPDDPERIRTAGSAHFALAIMLRSAERAEEAKWHAHEALECARKLSLKPETQRIGEALLFDARLLKGTLLGYQEKFDEAEAELQSAAALAEKRWRDSSTDLDRRSSLAMALHQLAVVNINSGRPEQAEPLLKQAIQHQQAAIAADPRSRRLRVLLRNQHHFLAQSWINRQNWEEAEAACRLALAESSKLSADFPLIPAYRGLVAGDKLALTIVQLRRDQPAAAETSAQEALAIYTTLVRQFPKAATYRHSLAYVHNQLGTLRYDAGDFAAANSEYRRAVELQAELAREHAHEAKHRRHLALFQADLAWFLTFSGDESLRNPAESLRLAQAAVAADPAHNTYHKTLGVVFCRQEQWEAALAPLQRALDLQVHDQIGPRFYQVMALAQLNRREEAAKIFEEARARLAKQPAASPFLAELQADAEAALARTAPNP